VETAKILIENARRQVSQLGTTPLVDAENIGELIDAAMLEIGRALKDGAGPSEYESAAVASMEHLRGALGNLQNVNAKDQSIAMLTQTVAKTLALLYPISQLIDNPSRVPDSPLEQIPPPGAERRRAPRTAIEASIGFQSETNFFTGFSEDISSGGIFIATFNMRPIGSKLNVNFTLPSGQLISVDGVVRWIREFNETTPDILPGMGIQFDDLHPSDKEMIESFIGQRPAMFFDE
jgi:uncharacterized protein (TIGR02266 family)